MFYFSQHRSFHNSHSYNEKFFYDKGAWIACVFPKTKYLMMLYFIFRFWKLETCGKNKMRSYLKAGIRIYHRLLNYDSYVNRKNDKIKKG